jgi:hypothetical protein
MARADRTLGEVGRVIQMTGMIRMKMSGGTWMPC